MKSIPESFMIPYDIDPSLYAHEKPEPQLLEDGFSPSHHGEEPLPELEAPVLSEKSPF